MTYFAGIQYCGAAFGTERMQHSMRTHFILEPERILSSSDYEDAYCNASRAEILTGVEIIQPALLDPIRRRLATSQDMLYYGAEDGPAVIKAREGLQQGASTSGDLYSLGIHPLNEQLHQIATADPSGILSAYMDDVKVHSSFESVVDIIKLQLSDGRKYGAKLKMAKQKIFLGHCASLEIAQAQKDAFVALSIPPDRIQIHPDNLPADQQDEARMQYGEVLIGIPVSPFSEYIQAQLDIIVRDIEDEVTKRLIPRLDDCPQLLHYFSKHILPHKFTHLLRGLPPEYSVQLTDCLTRLQRLILESLFDVPVFSDLSFDLARIREGCGHVWAEDIADCAYAASVIASLAAIEKANTGFIAEVQRMLEEGRQGLPNQPPGPVRQFAGTLLALDPAFPLEDYLQLSNRELRQLQSKFMIPRREARRRQVEEVIAQDPKQQTIYESGKTPEARAWLDAIPKTSAMTMHGAEFRTALRNRCLVPHPQLSAIETCACGRPMDRLGIHAQKCPESKELTNQTHDRVVRTLAEMFRSCGSSCNVEVTGIFQNVAPQNLQRMDLVVHDPGRPNCLYDVVVSNAVTRAIEDGKSNRVNQSQTTAKERAKERKYSTAAAASGMLFKGIAMEVQGKWGDDLKKVFRHFITQGAANSGISIAILANYWRRRISMALQKGVANAINTRINRLVDHSLTSPQDAGESASPGVIEEQSEAWVNGIQLGWGEGD